MAEDAAKSPTMDELRKEFVPREVHELACESIKTGMEQVGTDLKNMLNVMTELRLDTVRELAEMKGEIASGLKAMADHEKGHNNVWTRRHTGAVMISTIISALALISVVVVGILTIVY